MSKISWTVGMAGKEDLFSNQSKKLSSDAVTNLLKRNGYFRMSGGFLPISDYGAILYDSTNEVHEYFASIFYITQVLKAKPIFGKDNTSYDEMLKLLDPESAKLPEGTVID